MYDLICSHKDVANNLRLICGDISKITEQLGMRETPIYITIEDIGKKIEQRKSTEPSEQFFKKLMLCAKDPRFGDALTVLTKLFHNHNKIPTFWFDIVKENIIKAFKYGLSDKQIEFILVKSSTGKPGLAVRFQKIINDEFVLDEDKSNVDKQLDVIVGKEIEGREATSTVIDDPILRDAIETMDRADNRQADMEKDQVEFEKKPKKKINPNSYFDI